MPSLPFSQGSRNLYRLPGIDVAQIFIAFIVLLFSLTVHETAHAWTAGRLGDPTARLLGRVSLNPMVHADLIGTVIFPILSMVSGVPLIGWAKPVPVNIARLRRQRSDYVLVAAAGPASNLLLAIAASALLALMPLTPIVLGGMEVSAPLLTLFTRALYVNVLLAVFNMLPIPPLDGGNVLGGVLPRPLAARYDALVRPYGFILLYALMFTRGFDYLVVAPSRAILSWLV
ncbi:MAG TPA: site-2 protease family protein [Vicinamibacterales bacterium]|nr:site-2 protease family protein [Vicinamibacterales bacterium]